jgi:hypothetical protein
MVKFCTRHKIGFNPDFDPCCPQCTLSALDPAPELDVNRDTLDVIGEKTKPGEKASNLSARK